MLCKSNELQNNISVSVLFLYPLIGRESCALNGSPYILVLEQNMTSVSGQQMEKKTGNVMVTEAKFGWRRKT